VITTVLALEKTLEAQDACIRELEMQLHSGRVPNIVEFDMQLMDA
jgi:hypothetical protein